MKRALILTSCLWFAIAATGCHRQPNLDAEVNRILKEIEDRTTQPDLSRYEPELPEPGPATPDYDKALELSKGVTEVQIDLTQEGAGPQVEPGLMINLAYVGRLMDGYAFESTYTQGGQFLYFRYEPGQVIEGLYEGLKGIRVGEKRTITIPARLAYGEQGAPPKVPPNMALRFEVYCLWVGR